MRSSLGRFHRPFARVREEQLLLLNDLGDGSTLSLDFTTGVLDPRLTFTRSTSGTYIGADGLVKTATANTPRFDYDPTPIGTPRGLLIEGSAVNYMLESTSLSGYSNSNMVAVSSGSETDPEGNANSAKQIYASATTGYHGWYRNVTAGTNTTVTVSIWAKARNYTFLFLSDLASGRAAVRFNLQTGATDNNFGAGYVSARATKYTNDWWRCEMTASVTASTGYGWTFAGVPSTGATLNGFGAQYNGTGNAADGIYCYGFQVEGGSGASSYIPTGASTGSRGQDLVAITSTNFSSWWTSNNPASFLVDISSTNRPLANHIFRIADSSVSAYGYQSYFFSTTMPMQVRAAMSSTASSDVAIGSNLAANTRTKIGFTVETASLKRFRDGSLSNTLTTPTLPPNTLTQMYIGGTSSFGNSSADFHIKQFKYWPVTLSDAAMQGFTT